VQQKLNAGKELRVLEQSGSNAATGLTAHPYSLPRRPKINKIRHSQDTGER